MRRSFVLFNKFTNDKIIKNLYVNSCRNCIHFLPSIYSTDFTSSLNKCNKFGTKNIVSGKIIQEYADICRSDTTKCDYEGKYFEEEKNITFKHLNHKLISNIPMILLLSTIPFNLFLIFKKL